jgi:hypothetical protein
MAGTLNEKAIALALKAMNLLKPEDEPKIERLPDQANAKSTKSA